MKKYLTILFILTLFPTKSLADLNNFMWAKFPVVKYEFMVNEKTKEYKKNGKLITIGHFYISLNSKKIIFHGLELIDKNKGHLDTDAKFRIIKEEFKLKKIIKSDNENYVFEGKKQGHYERKISGQIKLKLNRLSAEVLNFNMNEFGQVYSGVMNRYVMLSSKKSKQLLQRFKLIDFGDYYAAMGDDSITY